MKTNSIRWRFPITYAVIALITALVSGGTLLAVLRNYYTQQEQNFLQKNAISIAMAISPILGEDTQGMDANAQQKLLADLKDHITLLALLSQTRVRLQKLDGTVVVDTGVPGGKAAMRVAALPFPQSTADGLTLDGTQTSSQHITAQPLPQSTVDGQILNSNKGSSQNITAQPLPQPTANPQALEKLKQLSQDIPPEKATNLGVQIFIDGSEIAQPVKTANTGDGNVQFIYRTSGSLDGKSRPVNLPPNAVLVSNVPLVGTMYGFELGSSTGSMQVRSNQQYIQVIREGPSDPAPWGILVLSDGPAYGMDIVLGVARAWALASLLAIIIAALIGWWISRRMSAPILALTEATGRMAEGDLTVRASPKSRDELGALGRSFNVMAGRVEEMVGALRRFAGDAAHELHTPLTALHTSLELLRSEPGLPEPARASVEQAWEETRRLETLSRDLLDLSRLEAGQAASENEAIDLSELVREISEPYASQAEQCGISFGLELPEEAIEVDGQRRQLCRAISNLLENAIKFTSQPGQVRITLSREDGEAVLQVQDTGIGIPEEDAPYVFNRFHRGRNATPFPGSGLGLAIVKAVIDRHGGAIRLEAMKPGTKVEVRLPMLIGM